MRRAYDSTARRRRAEETRAAIVAAARRLFLADGFAATTIAAIAAASACAAPTVYAMFGSKQAILTAILDTASFGGRYEALVAQVQETSDPVERIHTAARIASAIYQSERAELDLLRGAGVLSPEAALDERNREAMRYDRQKPLVDFLFTNRHLKAGLTRRRAREIFWALTGRDLFRLLVAERGWSPDAYERWLGRLLTQELLDGPGDGGTSQKSMQ